MSTRNTVTRSHACRFCKTPLIHTFVNLGMSPLCQTHVEPERLNEHEIFYPLHAYVCEKCFLVQVEEFASPGEIFTEYAYFSSFSDSWLEHAKKYCDMMTQRFRIGPSHHVFEIASNDGYLLQNFVKAGVAVLGIEPAQNVAETARAKGVKTISTFLGQSTACEIVKEHGQADLLLGNNVLAHVPDINDFVSGMAILLRSDGLLTMEFPHLVELMENNQFDTIYHEHFSYLSFTTVEQIFAAHGMTLFDVEKLPTHGGSIRIYGQHTTSTKYAVTDRVNEMKEQEAIYGINRLETYSDFSRKVERLKQDVLDLLIQLKRQGKKVAGYGAPGKGNTLLNYCAIRTDFLDFTVDRNPYKQGKYTPGTRIPILKPEHIRETKPDYLLILPWNLKDEIMAQTAYIREWGGKFIVPIPKVKVL